MTNFDQVQDSNKSEKQEAGFVVPETPEELDALAEGVSERIDEEVAGFTQESDTQIETGMISLGGTEVDILAAKNSVSGVREEIHGLSEGTKAEVSKQADMKGSEAVEVSAAERGSVIPQMKDEFSAEQLKELRAKKAEDYGAGLVSSFQGRLGKEGGFKSHEEAQTAAFSALDEKIEMGAVNPASINSEMLSVLGVRGKEPVSVESVSEVGAVVRAELNKFVEKGLIKPEEAAVISSESEKFSTIYSEAFPDASPDQVLEITRTNARKLSFQTERDKHVFSGSDHGTKHILEGNMVVADSMLDSLGPRVSAKDRVLIHQIMVDHDMGYTTGIAQANESFAASKDHPIFSAKLVEANKEYYIKMFGEDGYETILDVIKMHSYPTSDYDTPTDPDKGFNPEIIRSISSTADALGVTSETKAPAFFRQPDAIQVLQKVRLYGETNLQPKTNKKGEVEMVPVVEPHVLEKFKVQLREIADREPDQVRREAFTDAINNQFNPTTADMTLGQYTGVMNSVQMREKGGKMLPHIKMDISRSQALLGDAFGDKLSTNAFVKAMEDFGVPKAEYEKMAKVIRNIRNAKTEDERAELMKGLQYESDRATFEFGSEFNDTDPAIAQKFEEFETISIRGGLGAMSRKLEALESRTPKTVGVVLEDFSTELGEHVDAEELVLMSEIQQEILSNMGNEQLFQSALRKLITFRTKKETEFMGI